MLHALAVPLEHLMHSLVADDGKEFSTPKGEAALLPPDSISWRVFRNPLSMYVGGMTAVLMELAEPRIRAAVWDHSSFRAKPAARLQRTGRAAMITVYGARSRMEAMAARVRAMHSRISGVTPEGVPYRADDPSLLHWVQATAAFAFLAAYRRFVRTLEPDERDLYYAEGREGSLLFGVEDPVATEGDFVSLLWRVQPSLSPSPVLEDLLSILSSAPILPPALRWLQPIAARAAVDLLPPGLRRQLRLDAFGGVTTPEAALLRSLAQLADRLPVRSSPSAQACLRLGLPPDYLLSPRRGRTEGRREGLCGQTTAQGIDLPVSPA